MNRQFSAEEAKIKIVNKLAVLKPLGTHKRCATHARQLRFSSSSSQRKRERKTLNKRWIQSQYTSTNPRSVTSPCNHDRECASTLTYLLSHFLPHLLSGLHKWPRPSSGTQTQWNPKEMISVAENKIRRKSQCTPGKTDTVSDVWKVMMAYPCRPLSVVLSALLRIWKRSRNQSGQRIRSVTVKCQRSKSSNSKGTLLWRIRRQRTCKYQAKSAKKKIIYKKVKKVRTDANWDEKKIWIRNHKLTENLWKACEVANATSNCKRT